MAVNQLKFSVCISLVFLFHIVQSIDRECGVVKDINVPLIYNGQTVRRGDWPFLAAIFNKNRGFICGGTLLTRNHVLTAAHCIELKGEATIYIYTPEDITVRLGAHNITFESETGAVNRNVSDIYVHSDWDQYDSSFDADAAILFLSIDVPFTRYIQPICLPFDDDITILNTYEGHIVGWSYSTDEENGAREGVIRVLRFSKHS